MDNDVITLNYLDPETGSPQIMEFSYLDPSKTLDIKASSFGEAIVSVKTVEKLTCPALIIRSQKTSPFGIWYLMMPDTHFLGSIATNDTRWNSGGDEVQPLSRAVSLITRNTIENADFPSFNEEINMIVDGRLTSLTEDSDLHLGFEIGAVIRYFN